MLPVLGFWPGNVFAFADSVCSAPNVYYYCSMPKCSLSAGANEIYHGYIVYISRIRQVCNCNLINHSATQSDMLVPTKPLHFISFHIVWLYLIWFHFISLAASDRQKLPRKNRLAWVCFFRARAPLSVNILKGSSAANQKHKLAEIKSNPKAASLIISGFCTVWLFVIYCDVFFKLKMMYQP